MPGFDDDARATLREEIVDACDGADQLGWTEGRERRAYVMGRILGLLRLTEAEFEALHARIAGES